MCVAAAEPRLTTPCILLWDQELLLSMWCFHWCGLSQGGRGGSAQAAKVKAGECQTPSFCLYLIIFTSHSKEQTF